MALCTISNTGGYHRLFAHRAYRSAWGVRLFYLLFGAASGQGSSLQWSSDHRTHHAHTDEALDPHNVKKGFWWAHVGWLLYRSPPPDFRNVKDLQEDPLIRFQHRFYLPLAAGIGFLLPTLIACSWGNPLGGLLLAGFLRLALQYQATFSINSVTHAIGRRPYSTDTSARDSFAAALVTLGEGYHNFHHTFPGDYRNGVRLYHFDPTKWWIWLLSKAGLARNLQRIPSGTIQRAKERVCTGR
jgi:stearoyl-CoA desaturase (Delta-9 desaturase)